ncbi:MULTISPECIES: ribosomal maturation YjgA family protein [Microbacterium]|uniref:DUF2809 domain-containing protein n=1 Tax=Microbacterium testaceum TaxID=2033 RepID=A0A4Y3QHY9_MICTE|nr:MULTISPECIES: DUF2809 domain-containing protein [Microbacterium]MDZ5143077.1 DUF2809 domain-containing protein [Microbacterium testaceum]PNW08124.1 DUF2809 domain-containing protein [Microbacterium testaceum]REC99164.1 uncharacterized protein DUF2809 [Microbacterium sp. AG157]WJS92099.1 DUF2809 domain-containing protein [Microbacterium testaceum]GEB44772.1 hypothetical protein MTE01_07170 [Microbacterium testaceum]
MPPTRRRVIALFALAAVVAAGLVVHLVLPSSAATDIAGDALYTVAIYAGVVVVLPRLRPFFVGLTAGGWSVAVELFQATGIPVELAEGFRPIALVLGTGFDARDLVVYLCAAVVAVGADVVVGRSLERGTGASRLLPRG